MGVVDAWEEVGMSSCMLMLHAAPWPSYCCCCCCLYTSFDLICPPPTKRGRFSPEQLLVGGVLDDQVAHVVLDALALLNGQRPPAELDDRLQDLGGG